MNETQRALLAEYRRAHRRMERSRVTFDADFAHDRELLLALVGAEVPYRTIAEAAGISAARVAQIVDGARGGTGR